MKTFKEFLVEEEKADKKDVDYSKGMAKSHCAICVHYITPNKCKVVKGSIDPEYWCTKFKKS